MRAFHVTLAAPTLGLAALPALAGDFAFDLPRLEFPAPTPAPATAGADASRDCALSLLPAAPETCAPAGK
ncbi:hypothetical protein [Albidovulum sp.]|uniref:hypothetical protein n=1 Tax=Albidovulum sp. TaxID=1872424 RepID=UPI0039B903B7